MPELCTAGRGDLRDGAFVARVVVDTDSAEATHRLGEAFGSLAAPGDVLLLSGDLGAGKTQLVKGLARSLGVSESVTSPTFNILLLHEGRLPLYHIDLYRLDSPDQLEDIDYFGSLEAGGVAAVEWGDKFAEAAPPDHVAIELHILGDVERRVQIVGAGTRSDSLVRELAAVAPRLRGVVPVGE